MVVKESLRMYPPVNLNTSRHCVQDVELKTTQGTIPAGANIHVPVWQIHRNPEYWERPDDFVPERLVSIVMIHILLYQMIFIHILYFDYIKTLWRLILSNS